MEDHRPHEPRERGRRIRVCVARVNHNRQTGRRCDLELTVEEQPLDGTRREIVEVVESRLADSHGSWMAEQIDELIRARTLRGAGLMRVDPERGKDALLGIRDCDRGVAGRDPRANGYDSRNAHRPRTFDEECGGLVAAVEVSVGVDHREPTYAAGSSRRGNSGGAASMPCVSLVRP